MNDHNATLEMIFGVTVSKLQIIKVTIVILKIRFFINFETFS